MSHGSRRGRGRIRKRRLAQGPRQRVGYPKGLGGILPGHLILRLLIYYIYTHTRRHLFTRSIAACNFLLSLSHLTSDDSLFVRRHLRDRQSGRPAAAAAGDCPAESMEWWQKAVVVPVKRAWIVVAARLRRKKDAGKISVSFVL